MPTKRARRAPERPTPEQFLAIFPAEVQALANKLRSLIKRTVPNVIEAVYPGWRLIGYRVIEKEQRKDARYLKQIHLFEVSVVNTPMNPLAEIESVKSFSPAALDVVGRALEEAAQEMQRLARRVRGG